VVSEQAAKILIPCDETALRALDIFRSVPDRVPISSPALQLIDAWLGPKSRELRLRSATVEGVRGLGVRVPAQVIVAQDERSVAAVGDLKTPLVVKRDYSWGGNGVLLAKTADEARAFCRKMAGELTGIFADGAVVAQEFVYGVPVAATFSALRGRLLEAFVYQFVERQSEPFGCATVIRVVEAPEIRGAVERIVRHFGFSGFGGADFILPEDGGSPVFIELNPRPPQTAHLGAVVGADPCRALACALTGAPYVPEPAQRAGRPIALFPNEWMRNPASPHLHQGSHDVPWRDPRLVAAIIARLNEDARGV
jgi:predicted ATP-grasp superfamily ATP-dependent carboligase